MKLTNLSIKDLLNDDKNLTFLVGAGCSIDSPSCLPAGKAMMETLIIYTCHESEVEKILQIEDLRFEGLIEVIRDQLDKNLATIEYYGQCDKPNMQHFFLADMIQKGHFVMTTNFDFLIEYALLYSGVPEKNIVPVITREDFGRFQDPYELLNSGKNSLYKIHGSPHNIITNENTIDSLVATIQAFGSNKEGLDIFQMESFKRPFFENITNQRSLVVMGYSGSDDFDVVPTLKIIKNLKEIIWIDFLYDDGGKEKVYSVDSLMSDSSQNLDKVSQILLDIYETGNIQKIYRVNVNTSRMVKELLETPPMLSSEQFALPPIGWLKHNLSAPSDVDKFFIAFNIYRHFNRYDEAISCMHMMSLLSGLQPDNPRQANAYLNIAAIYIDKGDYEKAFEFYEDAEVIYKKIGDLDGISGVLNGKGMVYKKQGKFEEALRLYEQALDISKSSNNVDRVAVILDNMANIYRDRGNLSKASDYQEEALKIFGEKGMLKDRAASLTNIGQTLCQKGDYQEALTHLDQALKISEQLKDEKAIGLILEAKADVYVNQERILEAIELRSKAVQIFDNLGLKKDKAIALVNLANILQNQNSFEEAQEKFQQAHLIFKELNDHPALIRLDLEMGFMYLNQGDFFKALRVYREASQINDKLNISGLQEEIYKKFNHIRNNLALKSDDYLKQRNFIDAINLLKKVIEISEEWNDSIGKAVMLIKLARIYKEQGQPDGAIKCYEEAIRIFQESKEFKYMELAVQELSAIYLNLGKPEMSIHYFENLMEFYTKKDLQEKNVDVLFNLGVLYSRMGKFDKALEKMNDALSILNILGLEKSEKADKIHRQIENIENQKKIKAKFDKFENRFNI
ncbi:MAG: tetratricopeptide repeat protein [Promethearchaeota archaeon]|nr:MAG: tetratricopeptide repeat protein [Candidatus Lokiarchaeota archaeon]